MRLGLALTIGLALLGCRPPDGSPAAPVPPAAEGELPIALAVAVDETAVEVPLGKYFLVRRLNPATLLGYSWCAVKLTEETDREEGGCRYVWYSLSKRTGKFDLALGRNGKGEVFEKYRRTSTPDGGQTLVNDGGQLYIECAVGRVEWSQSRWIYFDSIDGPVEIAITDEDSIEKVSLRDPSLEWQMRRERAPWDIEDR